MERREGGGRLLPVRCHLSYRMHEYKHVTPETFIKSVSIVVVFMTNTQSLSVSRADKLNRFNKAVEAFVRELLQQYPSHAQSPAFVQLYSTQQPSPDYILKWFCKASEDHFTALLEKRKPLTECVLLPCIDFKTVWTRTDDIGFWSHVHLLLLLAVTYQLDSNRIVHQLQLATQQTMTAANKEKWTGWLIYIQNLRTKQEKLLKAVNT
jgi:hypothetical protein